MFALLRLLFLDGVINAAVVDFSPCRTGFGICFWGTIQRMEILVEVTLRRAVDAKKFLRS